MIDTTKKLAAAALLLIFACSGGVRDSVAPPTGPDTTVTVPPTGTVQRASVTVRVSIDTGDASLAQAAGVALGGITVRLQRTGSGEAPRVATTDAEGAVKFDNLLEGLYTTSVDRMLTATELARLPAADREAAVFAGGEQFSLSPPNARSIDVAIVAARRGSLVMSELFDYKSTSPAYPWGDYAEVYNNSDTTIFLDGIVLFRTTSFMQSDAWGPCSFSANFREDPLRLWVNWMISFPGSGREFPIRPGEGKVVAMDAINHTAASGLENYPDLSGAQFEEIGNEADTDNPFSANMIRTFNATGAGGRGSPLPAPASYGLALPSAGVNFIVDTLVQAMRNGAPNFPGKLPIAAIPAEKILDVFSLTHDPEYRAFLRSIAFGSEDCPNWLSPVFERRVAEVHNYYIPGAVRRKSLGLTPDGREILQRTHTSARDLERGPILKRSLRK